MVVSSLSDRNNCGFDSFVELVLMVRFRTGKVGRLIFTSYPIIQDYILNDIMPERIAREKEFEELKRELKRWKRTKGE